MKSNSTKPFVKSEEVCSKLIFEAQTIEDVKTILQENSLLHLDNWKPIGGDYGNETLIRHQSASAESAFGERCINSVDSILMRKCTENGVDAWGVDAPQSMAEAAEVFCNIPEGKLGKYTGKFDDICEIFCSATGKVDGKLTLNLVDFGEGQTPDYMRRSFLSLPTGRGSPYKLGIPFVQGRYNQGSGGSYKFSDYTLIVTRRAPSLLTSKARDLVDKHYDQKKISLEEIYKRKDEWGWTLVTRFARASDKELTWYGYLAPDGNIPSFKANFLNLIPPDVIPTVSDKLPKKKKEEKLRELRKQGTKLAYSKPVESGTLVKLFDFPMKSSLNGDLWREGQRAIRSEVFYELPMPIQLLELREWGKRMKGSGDAAFLTGLLNSIIRYDQGKNKLVRAGWPKNDIITIPELADSKIKLSKWILETERGDTSQAENWLGNNSIVYILNGQVHAHEETRYLDSLKLYNLKGSLLIAVDVNEMPIDIRDKIFRVDRTFMEKTNEAILLKEAIKNQIIKDPDIKLANDAKFFEQTSDLSVDAKHTEKIIQKLSKDNPLMKELLQGTELPIAAGGFTLIKKKGEKYRNVKYGKKSPTYFELKSDVKQ